MKIVTQCVFLQYVTLFGNPLQQGKLRHFIVNQIQSIKMMDDKIVKLEQRSSGLINQNTKAMKFNFPLVNIIESDQSSTFLAALILQLHVIRQAYLRCNPIIRIQRYWRKKTKKFLNKKMINIRTAQYNQDILFSSQSSLLSSIITAKMPIHVTSQQKVLSLFAMNLVFWNEIKKILQENVYVYRQFCVKNHIEYKQFTKDDQCLVLRMPKISSTKKFLPFFIEANRAILTRKIGKKQVIMNFNKSFKKQSFKQYTLKEKQKIKIIQKTNKINTLYNSYKDKLVILNISNQKKISIIKEMYHKCINDRKIIYPFYFQSFMKRNWAAVSIQRTWKGYFVRKIYSARQQINKNRSAKRIQRWVKNLSFIHRHKFLLYVTQYLKNSNTKTICITCNDLNKISKFNETNYYNTIFKIPFQNNTTSFINNQIGMNSQRSPFPSYLSKYINFKYHEKNQTDIIKSSNIYDILFMGCQKVQYLCQKDKSYCKFTYLNVEQTQNRKFIFALKSYQFKQHYFIKSIDISQFKQFRNIANEIKEEFFIASENFQNDLEQKWKKVKIRYYNGNQDLSCNLLTSSLKYQIEQTIIPKCKIANPLKKNRQVIHRSYLILDDQKSFKESIKHSVPNSQRYKQLFTDQSRASYNFNILDKLRGVSLQSLGAYSISNSNTIDLKKSKIHQIKQSHRQKTVINGINKEQYLNKLKKYNAQQHQKSIKLIEQKHQEFYFEKLKKYNKIRQNLHKNDDSFEKDFMKKGNQSIKIELHRFQKRLNLSKNSINQKSRQIIPMNSKQSVRYQSNLPTQIKQFSVNPSDPDLFFGLHLPYKQDKKKQQFSSMQNPDVNVSKQEKKKTKAKIKKFIHSVFPQEFYPLTQSKKLGFQLPKLKK